FGDCCLVLQLEPRFTMVNAAHEMHHLDAQMLDSLLTEHPSGLKVLAAPLEPAFADDITTAGLMKMIELLKEQFDYVIVDTASMLDELLLSLIEAGDQVLMVVDMDLPSVKNAKLALETLRLLKFPTDKVHIVMNRANAKARLDEKEIETALKAKIAAAVPSDGAAAASVNEGRPVVESQPKSRIAKGFESVAELVAGPVPEPPSGRGLFGRKWAGMKGHTDGCTLCTCCPGASFRRSDRLRQQPVCPAERTAWPAPLQGHRGARPHPLRPPDVRRRAAAPRHGDAGV